MLMMWGDRVTPKFSVPPRKRQIFSKSQKNHVEKKPEKLAFSTDPHEWYISSCPRIISPCHSPGRVCALVKAVVQGKSAVITWTSSPSSGQNPHTVISMVRRTTALGKQLARFPSMEKKEEKDHFSYPLPAPNRNFVTYLFTLIDHGYEWFLVCIAGLIHERSSLRNPFQAAPETVWECLEYPLSAAHTSVPRWAPCQLWGPG